MPGENVVSFDEELFAATGTVSCVGHVISCVVARTEAAAREGARAVRVEYEELPALVSIEDAIAHGSFFEVKVTLRLQDEGSQTGESSADWCVLSKWSCRRWSALRMPSPTAATLR